jgi:hypothetical protein
VRHLPLLELLEDRCVPVTWGTPWPDPTHLSISFAPDGTPVDGTVSELSRALGAVAPAAVWQREVLRAYQTWAASADLNFHVVPDGGQPFGAAGRPQGDPRFGDLRLAAVPQAADVFGYATPYDLLAGTGSGDVRLNSSTDFGLGAPARVDLFTVVLHEAGHALGLDHSPDPASVMSEPYQGARAGLGASDVAAIQALYGARPRAAVAHNTMSTAAGLGWFSAGGDLLGMQADGDLNTPQDGEWYRFTAPPLPSALTIQLERSGLSLLTPRVTVYDASGRAVASAASTDPVGGDLSLSLTGAPLATYYVKVEGATQDVFSVGAYRLHIEALPAVGSVLGLLRPLWESAVTTVADLDVGPHNSFATAKEFGSGGLLGVRSAGDGARGTISAASQADYYRLRAPAADGAEVLTVTAWGTDNGGLLPRVAVYDASQHRVAADVLTNEDGIVTLQVSPAGPGATYYLTVQGAPSGPGSVGGYFLGVQFGAAAVRLETLAQGTLGPDRPDDIGLLLVRQSGLFHFVLSAEGSADASVGLTVYDADGTEVARVSAAGGETSSFTVNLGPGRYQFAYHAAGRNGRPLTPISYRLRAAPLGDGIGPQLDDGSLTQAVGKGSRAPWALSDDPYRGGFWYAYYPSGLGLLLDDPFGAGYQLRDG